MNIRRILRFLAAALIVALGLAQPAGAQTGFPNRPITVVVPFPAGGNLDVFTRIQAERLKKELGVPVNVIDIPGGGTIPAVMKVLGDKANGYTLLRWAAPTFVTNPLLRHVPYDPIKDFIPLCQDSTNSNVIYVGKDSRYKSLKDLVAAAKQKQLIVAVNTIGAPTHLSVMQFASLFDIKLKVLTVGTNPKAVAAAIGGQADFGIGQLGEMSQFADRARALAILDKRQDYFDKFLPGVPTVAEVFPGKEAGSWINAGYAVKAGTPKEVVDRLEAALEAALHNEAAEKAIAKFTVPQWVGGVEATRAVIKGGLNLYGPVVDRTRSEAIGSGVWPRAGRGRGAEREKIREARGCQQAVRCCARGRSGGSDLDRNRIQNGGKPRVFHARF